MAESHQLINPFVGLRAFEKNEDYLFFGRSAEISDLLKKFGKSRMLAVVGSSGSGKSSLVKSGLLPAIYSGFLSAGSNWHVAMFRPGSDPIGNLTAELSREGVLHKNIADLKTPLQPIIDSTLRRSGGGLVQAYRQAHLDASSEKLLIVIDQFEELFRYSRYEKQIHEGRSDAIHFINLLLTATQQSEFPVYVLITMRSDFIGDCAEFRGLPESINEGQYLVPRMTRDEMREAITGPINYAGAKITPRLVTRLLNDVGNDLDQLPILQHAMMRTWDAWRKKNTPDVPIDLPDYEKIGTMSMALNQHAEEAYAELSSGEMQTTCELMFKALTDKAADVRGIRRPKSVSDLCVLTGASEKEIINLVEVFRKTGRTFLMPPPSVPLDRSSIIDISHESLMRVWQRLVTWTDEEVRQANIYKRLGNDAANEAKREASLWSDPELTLGVNWRNSFKSNEVLKKWAESFDVNFDQAIDFLKRSEEADEKKKRDKARRTTTLRLIAAALIILFAALSGISYFQKVKADHLKLKADTLATLAHDSSLMAIAAAESAHDSSLLAIAAAKSAHDSSLLAIAAAKTADSSAKVAINERIKANDERNKADTAKKQAQDLLKKVAVAEYQRLIREGPTDQDLIRDSLFNYKLVAYDYHLRNLKDSFKVANAIEKDDELYEKLFYCVKYEPGAAPPIEVAAKRISYSASAGMGHEISVSADTLRLLLSGTQATDDTIYTLKSKVCFFSVDSNVHRIFVSTEDNNLVVLKYNDQFKASIENTIPLGGLITALDYHNNPDVIFFGLKSGEIGYIKYENKKERNYQPVYRNQLSSRITSVDFFQRNKTGTYYLLATSLKGRAVVYQSGSSKNSIADFLNTNVKLTEISLPENQTDVKNAKYDAASDRIILVTSKNTKLWNPFVDSLLSELTSALKPDLLRQTKGQTRFYK